MCHDDLSVAPAAPHAGTAAAARDVVLTSADGTRFGAYATRAGQPTGAGIVVMPDVRGLHQFYKDLAVRFAEIGVDAVAIDYFGRTAGIGDRSGGFEYLPHVERTTPEGIAADVAAAMDYLHSVAGGSVAASFTVGFCFGGGYSWRQSADQPGLAGAIGFYGRPRLAAEVIDRMQAPLLLLAAGADANIPVSEVRAFARAVRDAGVDADLAVYDGAPHSFFDRAYATYRQACDDAWKRVAGFIASRTESAKAATD